MAIVYVDYSAATNGTGATPSDPKNILPGSLVADTTYSFKGGVTYLRSSTLSTFGRDNLVFNTYDEQLGKAIIDAVGSTSTRVFRVESNNVTIDNLHVKGATAPTGNHKIVNVINGYTNHTITNCILEGQDFSLYTTYAIDSSGDLPIVITDNEITKCGWGVQLKDTANAILPSTTMSYISRNIIHNTVYPVGATLGDGITLGNLGSHAAGLTDVNYNLIVSDNDISDYMENGIDTKAFARVIVENNIIGSPTTVGRTGNSASNAVTLGASSNGDGPQGHSCIIRGNLFHDIQGVSPDGTQEFSTIACRSSHSNEIYGNIAVNCQRFFGGFQDNNDYGNRIYNNVIDGDIGHTGTGQSYCIRQDRDNNSLDVYNNIFINCTATNLIRAENTTTLTYGYNIYDRSPDVIGSGTINYIGGDIITNPLLTSAHHPTIDSPCFAAGKIIFGARDYNGTRFNFPPTIGAYELNRTHHLEIE